ncbi:radical SAM protein, partial [Candidatus Micrarchaeota archaeon]|nr:radical SAM protein [Candidatus Micrarchaeota archaeon]
MNIKSKINYYKTNIPLVTKRFLRYKTLDMFDAVEIETNTECNRKCVNCPNFLFEREKGLMETNLYKKIINELSETKYNGRLSPHFYNEPLLDKRLLLLMSYTRDKLPEAFICVYTNGDLLDRKLFD